ncbi:Alpha/Beta hydrolase protein [Xylariales sp. PMI_506]|nr:Alpha/Beta hydrolase protein [Xylariales sp. PMI_506]
MSVPSALLHPYTTVLPYKRVEFQAYDSTLLRGNLYHAANAQKQAPIVIFVHGIGLVKEQYLENWFQYFVREGYHVLAYDNRSFGDSDGLPRDHYNGLQQAEDFIDAVTYVRQLPEVNSDKVFGWGVAHSGGVIAMASAMDTRIAGIIMFMPCIDGAWDKSRWDDWTWEAVQRHRVEGKLADGESVQFWPLTDDEAAGKGGSVLSGNYVRDWSVVGREMAVAAGNTSFTGRLTLAGIRDNFNTRPSDFFHAITAPVLWVMATNDVVCGPLDFTRGWYDKLQCPKEICILEGEHLSQYFDPGFPKSVDAMLSFLAKYVT